jgi:hypothetical protein
MEVKKMNTMADIPEQRSVSLLLQDKRNEYMKRTMKKSSLRIAIGPYILRGCRPTTEILITEKKRDGRRYLTFPQGVSVTAGEVMRIIRPIRPHPDVFLSNRGVNKVLGTVKVVGIVDNDRVEVRLLDGKFFGGTCVERMNIQ